jgi:arylsulfatase A
LLREQHLRYSSLIHVKIIAASLLVLFLAGLAQGAAPPPNVIFLLADDLGYADLGCYGQRKIKAPNIDKLAAEGMRFTQFYAGSPVCAPSRCVLLTGKHTGHASIRDNGELPTEGQRPIPSGTFTLGHLLQKVGYKTACIGKWGLGGPGSTGEPNKQGFDYFYGYLCQREAHNYYPDHLWRNTNREMLEGNEGGKQLVGKHYAHDLMADDALNFVRENKARPFFLYLAFTIPHVALQVPQDSLSEYKGKFPETPYEGTQYLPHPTPRAAYAAMVSRMDRDIGRLMRLLQELKLDENTIVFFTSDNGPTIKIGGADSIFFESAGPFRGLKQDVFEGGIRVPFIARWPGKIKAGVTSEQPCAFWDLLPTLADLTSAPAPKDIDGVSFLPTLLGRPGQKQHEFFYWEYHSQGASQAVRMGDWKAVRLNLQKNSKAPIQLFNLRDDIAERTDVAREHPDIVERVSKIMASAREPSDNPKWNFQPLPPQARKAAEPSGPKP